jgi:hypothetical protein
MVTKWERDNSPQNKHGTKKTRMMIKNFQDEELGNVEDLTADMETGRDRFGHS